jgi:hypothetical protein
MTGLASGLGYFLSKILSEIRRQMFLFFAISESRAPSACCSGRYLETRARKAFQATTGGEFFFLFFIACIPALC